MTILKYKHIFIDLDYTLYDFEKSSYETMHELYIDYNLNERGIGDFEGFFEKYKEINIKLWDIYRNGDISKEKLNVKRFFLTLEEYGIISNALAEKFAHYYINESPLKKCLFPGVKETLIYLNKKYSLHIITNGFEEVQFKKIKTNRLNKYFDNIITSEAAGCKKPDPRIFEYALQLTGALKENSLMIGDDQETDIGGARQFGIDQVYVNYNNDPVVELPTYEIKHFNSIIDFL